jgi:hypothetical protein
MKFFTSKKKDNVTVNVEIAIAKAAFSEPATKPEPPAPDLATKPADIVGYCFGYVCPEKHVNDKFDSITVDGYHERRVCQTCGAIARPATVKKIAEATWETFRQTYSTGKTESTPYWMQHYPYSLFGRGGGETRWNKFEFVKFLGVASPSSARSGKGSYTGTGKRRVAP